MSSITIATGSYDRSIRLFEARSGRCLKNISFGDSQVNCLAISPDRLRLAAGGNPSIRIFDIASGAQSNNMFVIANSEGAHTTNVMAIGFLKGSAGPMLYSASEDGHFKLWDIRSSIKLLKDVDTNSPINCAAVMPDQSLLFIGSQYSAITVWSLSALQKDGQSKKSLPLQEISFADDAPLRSIAVDPLGQLMCIGNNAGRVFCLTINPRSAEPQVENPQGSIDSVDAPSSPAPRGSNSHGTQILEHFYSFVAHNKYVLKCAISPNSKILATTSADYQIVLWNIPEQSSWSTLQQQLGSPAPGSQNEKQVPPLAGIADLSGFAEPGSTKLPSQSIPCGAPWEVKRTLTGHTRWVWDCAFSSCSNFIVSASSDHTGRLWELETAKGIVAYNHSKPVTCVAIDDSK